MGGDEEHQVVTGLVRVDEHRLPLCRFSHFMSSLTAPGRPSLRDDSVVQHLSSGAA
jgi:hypothetical protein